MSTRFTDYCKYFLENYGEIRSAQDEFRKQFFEILRSAESALVAGPWEVRCGRAAETLSLDYLQVFKNAWLRSQRNPVHFECGIDAQSLENHRVYFALDVEGQDIAWEERNSFLNRLDFLLQRYAPAFRSATPASHTPGTHWRSLLWEIQELPLITSDRIVECMLALMRFETFVDEALYLQDKQRVLRTDFRAHAKDPKPLLKWDKPPVPQYKEGDPGGQSMEASGGRFNTGCLLVNGGKRNYGPSTKGPATQNIFRLPEEGRIHGVPNGAPVCLSLVVRTTVGAKIAVSGYGFGEKDGERRWPRAFKDQPVESMSRGFGIVVEGKEDWQHVVWKGEMADLDWCDFDKQGLSLYLVTETQDAELRIDSVELCTEEGV